MVFIESNAFSGLILKTTLLVLHHTNAPYLVEFINVILKEVDTELERKKLDQERLCILVSLIKLIVTAKNGSRIQGKKKSQQFGLSWTIDKIANRKLWLSKKFSRICTDCTTRPGNYKEIIYD